MIDIIPVPQGSEESAVRSLEKRAFDTAERISAEVSTIMSDIRDNGWEAVKKYSLKFDNSEPYELSYQEICAAAEKCPPELYASLERSAANILDYQSRIKPDSAIWETANGRLGQTVRGLDRVGIYVPGGTAAYPSSVLMCALPAKAAGVKEIIMLTPPTAHLNYAVMAAAKIAGVNRVFALGGAQAIAALAYGAGIVPKADKIVGPGNAYVAAAKRLAYGNTDIDMIAGPSELFIIADDTANPRYAAADMLAQAEHDELASAIIAVASTEFADNVKAELEAQAPKLARFEIIQRSLKNRGAIFVCENLNSALITANLAAPEHLEIMTQSPRDLLPLVSNAGAVFLGSSSPEALGDYMAGPSHVLPTSGTARFFSPLSVESFIKRSSIIEFTHEGLDDFSSDIIRIANSEGLDAHANSIQVRLDK